MTQKHKYQKLELTWIGKGEEPKLEPRILVENPEYSYGDPDSGNMLIHGDNLLALKALEQDYSGKIKCIYIDPPYNTGSAFDHYDDNLEHSTWLNLIGQRLRILWNLLSADGTLWVSIDDYEIGYLRVLMDEICGRHSFIATNIWQKRYSRENREAIGDVHEYILVYAKNPDKFKLSRNKLPLTESQKKIYKNSTNNSGPWRTIPMTAQGFRPNQMYEIKSPGGRVHLPPEGRCWSMIEEKFRELEKQGRVYYGKDNNSQPNIIRFLSEVDGVVPWTWWPSDEVGHTDEAKKEMHYLFGKENAFATPKPERLIERVIRIATNEGDTILDSFLGSGTTSAVAHKMRRRWIGIEFGDHAISHCAPRLVKVITNIDHGGISESVGWQGGGGFKFYTLAPSLLNQDKYGNWVISKEYDPQKLAAAMAKQEGFRYNPHETLYWKQGVSSEQDFIFTTTQFVTVESLDQIHDDMQPGESLLICCKSYQKGCKDKYKNISIKKIPQMLLGRCEFGRDDYSLNIVNMPVEDRPDDDSTDQDSTPDKPVSTAKKKGKRSVQEINKDNQQLSLFD